MKSKKVVEFMVEIDNKYFVLFGFINGMLFNIGLFIGIFLSNVNR